jgi:hypothetical protein
MEIIQKVQKKRGKKPKIVNPQENIILSIENKELEVKEEPVVVTEGMNGHDRFDKQPSASIDDPVEGIHVSEEEPIVCVKEEDNNIISQDPPLKKRGRKPKGGKIVQNIQPITTKDKKPNIILHLKCFIKDLEDSFKSAVFGYSFSTHVSKSSVVIPDNTNVNSQSQPTDTGYLNETEYKEQVEDKMELERIQPDHIKDIWKKIKVLGGQLHNNKIDKKCACFWDSCEFDNHPIFIPKNNANDVYQVYGCFCSPECAVAYLMAENIDSSVKFERYQMLNHVYSKIYNYKKNIKPAPNPHYMLEKYYGNLTIQEYRSLLCNDRLFLVIDKPLTRIMPELHEDNDDFIINNKLIPINNAVTNKLNTSKTSILSSKFGLVKA